MKKFLFIFLSVLVLPCIIFSCSKSTEDDAETECELTRIVFASNDSFPGIEDAAFTIDLGLDTALVYNEDSLPYGTLLDSVVSTFYFTTTIGYAIFYSDSDTIVVSSADTLNFNARPSRLYVLSEDGKNERWYNIYVNVHQVDPDLFIWNETQSQLFQGNRDVHAEYFNDEVLLFTQDGLNVALYRSADGNQWSAAQSPSGLPRGANVRQIVKGKSQLYYADKDKVYSSADGLVWQSTDYASADFEVLSMLLTFNDSIWAVVSDNATSDLYFATMADGGTLAKNMQIGSINSYYRSADDHFPISDFSALAYTGKSWRKRAMIMGGFDAEGNSLNCRWNLEWISTASDKGYYRLENFTIEQPSFASLSGASVVWYDDRMLMFGGVDANTLVGDYAILESVDEGMNWSVPDTAHNMLPESYSLRQRQAACVTDNDVIVLVGGQSRTQSFSDVYCGKKNSMSFLKR